MTVSQVRDLVRSKLGIPDLPPEQLDYFLIAGRRSIESAANLYWMAANVDFTIPGMTDQLDAVIDIQAIDYKEPRHLFLKRNDKWYPVSIGTPDATLPYLDDTTDIDTPQFVQAEDTLFTFMPAPDEDYEARLYYFKFTDNPVCITDTDELFTRWPQMILYAALAEGINFTTTNTDLSVPWFKLMLDEIEKAKKVTKMRLKEANMTSVREAAKVLQAQAGGEK